VLLGLDLGLGREAVAAELRLHLLAELGLGQEEKVLVPAAEDDERCDHARLRSQEQRLAGLAGAERGDVVGDHPVEIGLRLGTGDSDEGPRT
jgi:hypothetical protein